MLFRVSTVILLLLTCVCAHKILLYPISGQHSSHLMEMRSYGSILRDGGHDVTFLTTSNLVTFFTESNFDVISFQFDPERNLPIDWSQFYLSETVPLRTQLQMMSSVYRSFRSVCEAFLADEGAQQQIHNGKFDLLFYDGMEIICSGFVDAIMKHPPKLSSSHTHLVQIKGVFPEMPSFIPHPRSKRTHSMSFMERVSNFNELLISSIIRQFVFANPNHRQLEEKYNISMNRDYPYESLHLVLYSPFLDFPRPLPPSVIPVGGMLVEEQKPLPDSLRDFIEASGEHGVVVVSFGTLVHNLDSRSVAMAKALSRLPQRVIWKYETETPPEGLGSNTLLVDWMPQNDVLAHPKVKAFVTHCGIKSTHEAVFNGVPVLAVPFHTDQFQNALKVTQRARSGIQYNFHSLTEESFFAAVSTVVGSKELRENAVTFAKVFQRASSFMKDQLLFHVDHLVESGSASQLISPATKELSTFQLYLVDVLLFDVAVLLLISYVFLLVSKKLIFCMRQKTKVD